MKFKEVLEYILEDKTGSNNPNWKSAKTSRSWKYDASKQDNRNGKNSRAVKNPKAKNNEVGYRAYHMRIQKEKGKASSHKCRKCGAQAHDWAIVGKGKSIPLCRSCHNKEHNRGKNFTKNK